MIFAGGPRAIDIKAAREIQGAVPPAVGRVGVFGPDSTDGIVRRATAAGVTVVQLHGDPDAESVNAVRERFGGEVWAVARVGGDDLPERIDGLFGVADAVVLDARSDRGLGGTGIALPWRRLAGAVTAARCAGRARLVVAGGLIPGNVGEAISALAPDVVDVSSGVESAPGVKDHRLMRAFAVAAGCAPGQT
jgi:phosphoribosylanthranilate isomerase